MAKRKKFFSFLFATALNILAGGVIWYFWQPVASWYYARIPAFGVDLYNSVTHAAYYSNGLHLPFNSYWDLTFAGFPSESFPQLGYMLMVPFTRTYGLVVGVQVFAMFVFFLFLFSSYLLFQHLSKNHGISILLTVLLILSTGIYGTISWAGSIPYFASLFFFPLGLLFGLKYLETPRISLLAVMALISGIGVLVHPLGIIAFLVPSLILLIVAAGLFKKLNVLTISKHIAFYIVGFFVTSFIYTYQYIQTLLFFKLTPQILQTSTSVIQKNVGTGANSPLDLVVTQMMRLFSYVNPYFFLMLGISIIAFIFAISFSRQKKKALFFIPLLVILLYAALQPILNLAGVISFFKHDAYRAYWQFCVVLGAFIAYLWGFAQSTLYDRTLKKLGVIFLPFVVITSAGFVCAAFIIYSGNINKVTDKVERISESSSAFPEVLDLKFKDDDLRVLKSQLVPSFIDPSDKNKRLYAADATVNIWWNGLYDMPMVRGYIDPPIGMDRRGGFFILDTAMTNNSIIRDLKFSEQIAKNYAKYFIDWYSVYYYEGGHISPASYSPPSTFLLTDKIFSKREEVVTNGAIMRSSTKTGKQEARNDLQQKLIYYQLDDTYTSPVMYASDAPTIAVFTNDSGFEQLWRGLGMENLNSRYVIPLYTGKYIDDLSEKDFADFDAVILHNYSYHNRKRAFTMLSNYVEKGGKIFIDTGGEIQDSSSNSLDELIPVSKTMRGILDKTWNWEISRSSITDGVDFNSFGPPLYNGDAWKFSFPPEDSDVREGSKILLKNNGKPLLIEKDFGSGKVIWSGFNLLAHLQTYPTEQESKFLKNIISQLIPVQQSNIISPSIDWENSEHVKATIASPAKGLLFKEELYNGWNVKSTNATQKLTLYKTGPTYPGFMYVPLRAVIDAPISIEFSYNGTLESWVVAIVSLVGIIVLIDIAIIKGVIVSRKSHRVYHHAKKKMFTWWEKEEDV